MSNGQSFFDIRDIITMLFIHMDIYDLIPFSNLDI